MRRREFKQQCKRVKALAKKWLGPLGLLYWTIDTQYYDSTPEFRAATGLDAVMSVCAEWEYMRATISVNVPAIAKLSDDRLECNYVHECMHVLLAECRHQADGPEAHHEEHAATMLAKAFRWVQKGAG